jgi:5-methyltetrahydropteroyltriglutamate--homocysteine methyltransferase
VQVRDVQFLREHASPEKKIKITVPGPFTMSQQAQDDYYGDGEALAVAYAGAVNEEIKDLFAAGADVVQLDEPYMQARPDKARRYGLKALERALDGVTGTYPLHICFGYAHLIHERPEGYSFLPELSASDVQQISIETAQSHLDTSVLETLPGKTIILGVLDSVDARGREARNGRRAIRRALPHSARPSDHHRPRLRAQVPPARVAFGKMKANGRRSGDRCARSWRELQDHAHRQPAAAARSCST